jgi:DNA-directed RNA polymerase subunit RPC12/RpoP
MESTAAPLPAAQLRCTQCGSELHPDEGELFVTCANCNSTIFVDKSRVVFHYALAPTVDEAKARTLLAQWMAGNATVKDLDKKSQLVSQTFGYFPLWYFKRKAAGRDEVMLEAAAATSVSELRRLTLPAGDLQRYDASLDSRAEPPSVPLDTALGWLRDRGVPLNEVAESALVHIPLYTFKYSFNNQTYTALVEAATGKTLANIYPAKAEAPYLMAGCASALAFLALSLIPIFGALLGDVSWDGYLFGLAICSGLGVIAAPFLFGFAAWVAAKV